MKRILSDESLRRALMHLAPCPEKARTDDERARREAQLARSEQWMDQALRESIGEALRVAWILDCDTTIKVLYGYQAGAVPGYNPQKSGRPSHSIHTYWIANVRLALDAEVQPGHPLGVTAGDCQFPVPGRTLYPCAQSHHARTGPQGDLSGAGRFTPARRDEKTHQLTENDAKFRWKKH